MFALQAITLTKVLLRFFPCFHFEVFLNNLMMSYGLPCASSTLFSEICGGDEVGTSLNVEAAVHKYHTEEML